MNRPENRKSNRPQRKLPAVTLSPEDAARLQAIDKLASQADKAAAVEQLIEALKDASPAVRADAAHALGEIGPAAKPAAEALVALIADPSPAVRRQAIKALYAIHPGQQVTLPLFIKLLEDADPGIRMACWGQSRSMARRPSPR